MRYPNLRAEMTRNSITVADLARTCECSKSTVEKWLYSTGIPSESAFAIKETFFPELGTDYLFDVGKEVV